MPDQPEQSAYRLPRPVIPERYELRLSPDLGAFRFDGEERVSVQVREPVREVVLNAIELEIHEACLTNDAGVRLSGTTTLQQVDERARITLDGTAEPGHWTLELRFSGTLNDKLHGFYRSVHRDSNGGEHVIATTQFEATDARRGFPCWDEPDFKAVFAVTLVVDEELMAVSNAAMVAETRLANGKREVRFADTIPMSTYLVAFVVGPLEATDPVGVDGTPLRVVCVPGKRHLADYALEVGAFSVRFFADYYGIRYPGDKLDLIALPDFASGAMENLGAVTFRETALLVDRQTASRADLQRVADVVAHEIAHMWFGDLVTMRWWNGIWLNEAFATFMEMLAVDAFKPEWERWVSFGLSRGSAMLTDALKSTRPIEFPVGRPEECESMFDVLTYDKGAAVLRMLEQYLGGANFQRGIRLYLNTHRLANTETTDLWDAIQEATGEPARGIMDSWIFQGGFPVVSVESSSDGRQLSLSQRRFRYLEGAGGQGLGSWEEFARSDPGPLTTDPLWRVPVMLRMGSGRGNESRRVLLDQREMVVDLTNQADWVVANEGGHGFYRVRYSAPLLRKLTANVQQNLSAVERFNLVGDTWASVVAGLTPVAEFLDLARLFGDEMDRNVWVSLIGALSYLHRMLEPYRRPVLHAFVRELIGPAATRLGWTPRVSESELTAQLRGTLIGALGTLGEDAQVQSEARQLHSRYVQDRSAVDRDVAPAVINIVAHAGGRAEYDLFVERSKNAPTPQEEQRYLFGLAGFLDRGLVQHTLDSTLTDEVRTQNAPYLIGSLLHNLVGGDLAWTFVKQHWDAIVDRFPDNSHVRMLEGITALSTPELASDVQRFFATHAVKQGAKTLEQHLERLQINVAFRQREADNLAKYLDQ